MNAEATSNTNQEATMAANTIATFTRNEPAFLATHAGAERILYVAERADGPWAICGREPFTHGYAVCRDTATFPTAAEAEAQCERDKARHAAYGR